MVTHPAIAIAIGLGVWASDASAAIRCLPARPIHARTYFAWREIGGHRCWYAGHARMAKGALYWSVATHARAEPMIDTSEAPTAVAVPAGFDRAWQDMMLDLGARR